MPLDPTHWTLKKLCRAAPGCDSRAVSESGSNAKITFLPTDAFQHGAN